ncbi:transcriptional regulator [Raoultella planticola]|uniref:Transcriptional regulator n=1 Tax=Raoultella planticola TaxID=575 RepID=A0A443VHJ6_RAOPL|nr:transcriptional regulator [Raoultella planticola]
MRDLILQLSKSSIYSTKPRIITPRDILFSELQAWKEEGNSLFLMLAEFYSLNH